MVIAGAAATVIVNRLSLCLSLPLCFSLLLCLSLPVYFLLHLCLCLSLCLSFHLCLSLPLYLYSNGVGPTLMVDSFYFLPFC